MERLSSSSVYDVVIPHGIFLSDDKENKVSSFAVSRKTWVQPPRFLWVGWEW